MTGQMDTIGTTDPSLICRLIVMAASLVCPALSGCASLVSKAGTNYDNARSVPFTTAADEGESCSTGRCGSPSCSTCSEPGRELAKVSLPEHVIEPPDILLIEATNSLRPSAAPLRSGEVLQLQVANTIPIDPLDDPISRGFKGIAGRYQIQADGQIDLGPAYGSIPVKGLTLNEARRIIELSLRRILKAPQVMVSMVSDQARQHVSGEHLVRPDGTVSLGVYGSVYVAGLTLSSARRAIERHLEEHIHGPEVTVDVLSYNSKVYYIVTDGAGAGEQVFRFPCTGSETVLDAMAQINGLPSVSSKKHIWIARPAPAGTGYDQRIDIDWNAIVQNGRTETNYQVLPGDRIYIKADNLVTFDTGVARLTAPFERMLGFALLGNGTVRALQRGRNALGGGGF
jgi:protein involved in polysaccharide export with SLBB domain